MSESNRWFQWVVGEKKGQIVIFDHIESEDGIIYIVFKDKTRINEQFVAQLNVRDLTGKFMAEIDHPNNCWQFKERQDPNEKPRWEKDANTGQDYEVPPVEEVRTAELTGEGGTTRPQTKKAKIIDLIPPRPTAASHSAFGRIRESFIAPTPPSPVLSNIPKEEIHTQKEEEKIKIVEADPTWILYSKSAKSNTTISVTLDVSIPSQNLYNIAKESFAGENKFIDYIFSEINSNSIADAIKKSLIDMYENSNISDEKSQIVKKK